jgi:hypothetical protein
MRRPSWRHPWLGVIVVVLTLSCGSSQTAAVQNPSPSPTKRYPPPGDLDPSTSPNAISVINIRAMRSVKQMEGLVRAFARVLPENVALEDVEWIAVDGPSAFDSPMHNITFVVERTSREPIVVRGTNSGFRVVAPPVAPAERELVRVRIHAPAKMLRVPFFAPPRTVDELSLEVEAHDDDGVNIHLREHCTNHAEAVKTAAALEWTIARLNRPTARALTRDLLRDAKPTLERDEVSLDVHANSEQLEAIAELAKALLLGP